MDCCKVRFAPGTNTASVRAYLRYRDELVSARSPMPAHAKGAPANERATAPRLERRDRRQRPGHHPGDFGGQRDPVELAALVDRRVRASQAHDPKALVGITGPNTFLCSSPPLNSIIREGKNERL